MKTFQWRHCLIIFLLYSCSSEESTAPKYEYIYEVPEQLEDGLEVSSLENTSLDQMRLESMMTMIHDWELDQFLMEALARSAHG